MKRKTRKFASGGDIITGLGAVLVGKALYDKYKEGKGKDDGDSDYAKKVREYNANKSNVEKSEEKAAPKKDESVAEEKVETKREPSAGEKRAMAASKGRPELFPEGTTDADKATMYSDNYPVAKSKPVAKKVAPKKVEPKKDNVAPAFKGEGMDGSDKGAKKEPPVLKAGESKVVGEGTLKPYPEAEAKARKEAEHTKYLQTRAGLTGRGITTPGNAKAGDKSGSTQKGRSENPIQGTIDNAFKSVARTPQQKMAEGAREVERRRQAEKKKKEDEAYMRELERGKAMRKGGAVKKYASGGSVKTAKPTMRSASSRADGIAIRGKTRA